MKLSRLFGWAFLLLGTPLLSVAQNSSISTDSLQKELTTGETNHLPFDPGIEVDGQYFSPGLWIRQSARYKKPSSTPSLYAERYVYQIYSAEDLMAASGSNRAFLPKPFGRSLKTVVNLENQSEIDTYNERMLLEEQTLLARRKRATYLNFQIGAATLGGDLRQSDSYLIPFRLQIHPPLGIIHPTLHGLISAGVTAFIDPQEAYEAVSSASGSTSPLWEHFIQARLPTKGLIIGYRYSSYGNRLGQFEDNAQWLVFGIGNEAIGKASLTGYVRIDQINLDAPLSTFQDPTNYGFAVAFPLLNIGNGKKRLTKRLEIAAGQHRASQKRADRIRTGFGL